MASTWCIKDIESKDWDGFVRFVNHEKYIEAYFFVDDVHDDGCKELNRACEKIESAARVLKRYFFKPIKMAVKSMYSSKILVEEDFEE